MGSYDNIGSRFGKPFCRLTLIIGNNVGIFNAPVQRGGVDFLLGRVLFYFRFHKLNIKGIADYYIRIFGDCQPV